MPRDIVTGLSYQDIPSRRLKAHTCKKFGYGVADHNGATVQVAPYTDKDGRVVAQKLRYPSKKFETTGEFSKARLFGQQLWKGNSKRLVVTEGEIDAMAYSQMSGLRWPVVSVPNGASSARKAIVQNIDWLCSFDEVVFMFDNDEPGRKAAAECAEALPPGRASIATLPLKDAGEMLVAGRFKETVAAVFEAAPFRPDGLKSANDFRQQALAPVEWGLPWPWETLTRLTFGRRRSEVYGFGAGTGVGKTDFFTQVMAHTLFVDKLPVGGIFLEQPPVETIRRVAGKYAGKRFHVPDAGWTTEELEAAINGVCDSNRLTLYDHFGAMSWDAIYPKIRYMVQGLGIKDVFLDHLTALAAAESNEREALEEIMAEAAQLTRELDFTLYYISHLATPEGAPHEEGGRVMIRHFKGSRSIGFWSNFMFGLERDQQSETAEERKTTYLRILKDRNTGQSVGEVIPLLYDENTGMLNERNDFAEPEREEPESAYDDCDDF